MLAEPLIVRQATVDDVPFMRAMIWEAMLASPAFIAHHGIESLQQSEERHWQAWGEHSNPAFVAVDATGRKVGAITLRPHTSPAGQGWQIGIGVEANVRGHRIGQRLIEWTSDYARETHSSHLNLFVDPANAPAIALYRRTGFVEVGEQDHLIEMRLSLR